MSVRVLEKKVAMSVQQTKKIACTRQMTRIYGAVKSKRPISNLKRISYDMKGHK